MSESNAPFDRQQPNRGDSLSPESQESLANPFLHAMKELEMAEQWAAEGVVPDSVGSVSPDGGLPMSPPPVAACPSDSVTLTPGAEDWVTPSESTNLTDLISLIQELNQCNTILLDRVSQLEEALERSQTALKAEVKRSQDHPAFAEYSPNGLVAAQELSVAQEQIVDLYNQLEFVHQTSQRQQILVETLTGQLEASQERVAHLEREAALVQRRYNEQSQILTQYESSCRDLQARLHRQQRYTLQFKAALEKSLEVSSPPFESVAAAVAAVSSNENFFLPKAQRIQPWAVPEGYSPTHLPWMKLSSSGLAESDEAIEPAQPKAPHPSPEWADPRSASSQPAQPAQPRLSVVKLPGFGHPIPRPAAQTPSIGIPDQIPNQKDAVASSLNQKANQAADASIPDPKLMQKLDAAVQPLADMLAEVMLAEASQAETAHSTASQTTAKASIASPESAAEADLPDAEMDSPVTQSSDEALLNSVMADAEDALWQDLARLIDVSTEEIVKASLSGDVSAFESIDFEAVQPAPKADPSPWEESPEEKANSFEQSEQSSEQSMAEPASTPSQQMPRPVTAFAPKLRSNRSAQPSTPSAQPTAPEVAASAQNPASNQQVPSPAPAQPPTPPAGSNPSWPSPVVYPLRPAKKRRSLAAVDLPSFLQQEPGPLPT